MHQGFEWDPAKALANADKHGVTFGLAARMLADFSGDVNHVIFPDDAHSRREDRFFTLGTVPGSREDLLAAVWTERGGLTRIISARYAQPDERRRYVQEINQR